MHAMRSISAVGGSQFAKARMLKSPVAVIDPSTFRIPSSSRDERDHKVQLDDPENPAAVSCTCEAGEMGKPCWAMARALDALEVMRAGNIFVAPGAPSSWAALKYMASALH